MQMEGRSAGRKREGAKLFKEEDPQSMTGPGLHTAAQIKVSTRQELPSSPSFVCCALGGLEHKKMRFKKGVPHSTY